jgi:hypothetical protein
LAGRTRFYAWHITLDDQAELHEVAARYQEASRTFDALDVVSRRWLHMTMQGVDHVQAVPDAQRDAIVAAVEAHLDALPVLHREAVVVPFM